MTRKQAADLLGISLSTLQRRTKAGQYTATKTGTRQFAAVAYSHAGLGLPEPQRDIVIDPRYEDEPPKPQPVVVVPPTPEPSAIDRKLEQDAEFAARYLAGEATDSSGNRVDGRNDMFPSKGIQSLLGPVPRQEPAKPPSGASHMDPALVGGAGTLRNPQLGEGFTRHGAPLAAGLTQEAYDEMLHKWQRAGGKRSMSEQEEANRRSGVAIHRAFPEADRT